MSVYISKLECRYSFCPHWSVTLRNTVYGKCSPSVLVDTGHRNLGRSDPSFGLMWWLMDTSESVQDIEGTRSTGVDILSLILSWTESHQHLLVNSIRNMSRIFTRTYLLRKILVTDDTTTTSKCTTVSSFFFSVDVLGFRGRTRSGGPESPTFVVSEEEFPSS